MILDTHFFSKTGIKLDYNTDGNAWYQSMLPMHNCKSLMSQDFDHMEIMYHLQFEDEFLGYNWIELYATEILDWRYLNDAKDVADAQHQLTAHHKCDLLNNLWRQKTI